MYTNEELAEALRAITSTLSKSEKALLKLKAGTFQHTMTAQGIAAYRIAIELINRGSEVDSAENPTFVGEYPKDELESAVQAFTSAIGRIEKMQPKFEAGTPQYTLAVRRIKAFHIAIELLERELGL